MRKAYVVVARKKMKSGWGQWHIVYDPTNDYTGAQREEFEKSKCEDYIALMKPEFFDDQFILATLEVSDE